MSDPAPASSEPRTPAPSSAANRVEAAFIRFLEQPKLHFVLAGIAIVLSSPALFLGYHLDDYIAQYIYTGIPGSEKAFEVWSGGYGVGRGDPVENLWQVEAGWAPWWIKDDLLVRLFRPLGVLTHHIDGKLWPNVPPLAHAHSLLWMGAMVLAVTRMFRTAMGPLVGGLAALLFAFDHTHGFTVGYICNRHALVSGTFAVLCLGEHIRFRQTGKHAAAVIAPACLVVGLLASEATVSIVGYLVAYAAFADRGALLKRGLSLAPYLVVVVVWRGLYNAAGYGAVGSGMYLDPVRESAAFLMALLERGPVLVLGQFLAPPAEFYVLASPSVARLILVGAAVFLVLLLVALVPLMLRERLARFWAGGALLSMVPAASAYPHNRQLLLVSFGAMALIAQLWHTHALTLKGQKVPLMTAVSGIIGAMLLFAHLIVSPIALPLTTCSVAFTAPLHRAIDDVGDEIAARDAVFVTAPEYFAVKLIQLSRRANGQPLPRRWRTLSFGPEPVTVHRLDARTLVLDIEGGILTEHILELYRDRRIPMPPGSRVELEGMTVEVKGVTEDGRPNRVAFVFDDPLTSDQFRFYYWRNGGFGPFELPPVGRSRELPRAELEWGL